MSLSGPGGDESDSSADHCRGQYKSDILHFNSPPRVYWYTLSNTQGLRPLDLRTSMPRDFPGACYRIARRYCDVNSLPPERVSGRVEQDPTGQTVGPIGTMHIVNSPTDGAS